MRAYDVRAGGIQRVHTDDPGFCLEWVRATRNRSVVVHLSVGPPIWWLPNLGKKRYSGITEYRAGWLLASIQVATKRHRK